MDFDWAFFGEMFFRTFAFWWIILPAIFLGLIVGAIPGFSAANTIIILLPLTLAMDPEVGLVFMVALYASSRMGAVPIFRTTSLSNESASAILLTRPAVRA